MLFMARQYIDFFKKTEYDINLYNVQNGPITDLFIFTENPNDYTILNSPISKLKIT